MAQPQAPTDAMVDPPASEKKKSIMKRVSKKFKKTFRRSLSKSKSDKPTPSPSSADDLNSTASQPELRRSLSESDCRGSEAYSRRRLALSPLAGIAQGDEQAEEVDEKTCTEGSGADVSESGSKSEECDRSSFSEEEAAALKLDVVKEVLLTAEGPQELTGPIEVAESGSAETGPDDVTHAMQIGTPKMEREHSKTGKSEMGDGEHAAEVPVPAEDADKQRMEDGKDSEMVADCELEDEPAQKPAEEETVSNVALGGLSGEVEELDGLPSEEALVAGEEQGGVVEGKNQAPEQIPEKSVSLNCLPSSKLLETASGGGEDVAIYDAVSTKERCIEEAQVQVQHSSVVEVPVEEVPASETREVLQGASLTENPKSQASIVQAITDSTHKVASLDAEEWEFKVAVASQTTRDFAIENVEECRKIRNSCSQVDEVAQTAIPHNIRVRQSADIGMGQLQECTAGSVSQERVPKWRWVRKVVAPVTFVTGAVILKIVTH